MYKTQTPNAPMLSPATMHSKYWRELESAAIRVIHSGRYILGHEVEDFEKDMARYLGVKHAIGVSSGTDALVASLIACDLPRGSEVICPSFTFFATAGAVARCGLKPVFADIDPLTFNINIEDARRVVTENTTAIIPVHLFGQSADMGGVLALAQEHGLRVIEDCAQAIGAEYKDGRKVGGFGDLGCFSFFPSKNLGGFGDAGLVTTNDDDLAERVRCARNHGMTAPYEHAFVGGNFRIDALQAALLRVKLHYLSEAEEARRAHARYYGEALKDSGFALPEEVVGRHVYNQYTIQVPDGKRGELQKYLKSNSIDSAVYYPTPLHKQPCFTHGFENLPLPNTEFLSQVVLSIPVAAEVADHQIQYVAEKLLSF